jgi:hypothetical protein
MQLFALRASSRLLQGTDRTITLQLRHTARECLRCSDVKF